MRLVAGEHTGEGEEAGLHDGVDPPAHPGGLGNLHRVDDVELQLLLQHRLLELARQLVPQLVRGIRRVDQHHRSGRRQLEHVQPVDELELVHAHEPACLTRYDERIGPGPKRRWLMVIAPDFFES